MGAPPGIIAAVVSEKERKRDGLNAIQRNRVCVKDRECETVCVKR